MRLSSAYAAVAGTEPAAAAGSPIYAKVSKSKREFGLRPRGARLARTVGSGDAAFQKYTFLPLRSITDAASATYAVGATITIDTVAWTVISLEAEDY